MRAKDITGEKFGKLTAIRFSGERVNGIRVWEFICECGNLTKTTAYRAKIGQKKSCGCSTTSRPQNEAKDILGEVFGRLTVIARDGSIGRRAAWKTKCVCGNEKIVTGKELRSGHTRSCGCLSDESRLTSNVTHGKTYSRTYRIWAGMIQRCTNPSVKSFKNYGERGITVDPSWLNFDTFFKDMGDCPDELTLERINNDLGYNKGNCKWADRVEQANNRRPRKPKQKDS